MVSVAFLLIFSKFHLSQVAGAAAACGLPLADVAAEAKRASEMVGTMGVALSVCTLPGQVTSDRLGPGKMELGLGIVSSLHRHRCIHLYIRNGKKLTKSCFTK